MWSKQKNIVSPETIKAVVDASQHIAEKSEDRHFVAEGKSFFRKNSELLNRVHREIDQAVRLRDRLRTPAVNHAFLLYKSGPGPATKAHQDRPYWLDIEDRCTMFTVWIALDAIDENKGALRLNPKNETDLDGFFANLGDKPLLSHVDDKYGGGGFATTIDDTIAREIEAEMTDQPVGSGDIVLFDAFEPHSSTKNGSTDTRLAMKIVYGEKESMKSYLGDLDTIEGRGIGTRLLSAFLPRH